MTPSHPSSRPGGIPTPALTPLLGRDNELAELGRLLVRDDVRLVALTGGPGVGKTRLAARVVDVAQQDFDHVAWVSLEALRDSELVSSAIARTLGLDVGKGDIDVRLRDRLTQDRWLVALDNFEQVLTAAPLLTDLLTASPELTIVVTSRARLNVRGEHEFVVPPLALPGAAQLDNADALRSTPAVNLFLERARAAQPGLELTHEAARAVAEICIRLDGIPLGIELAAARLRMLTPQGILAELEESLDVLGQGPRDLPSRQQTWRRALEWSYELLDEDARCLLMRLAVFVGGWTTGAAMAVTDGDRPAGNVLDTIAALVDSSLVQPLATPDGEPRFRMLDTVRQFAMEQLVVEGQVDDAYRRLDQYLEPLVDDARDAAGGQELVELRARLAAEHDNLRALLRWAVEGARTDVALKLVGSIWRFWELRGDLDEGHRWCEQALELEPVADVALRGRALTGAARLATSRGDLTGALSLYQEALDVCETLDDQHGAAATLNDIALVYQLHDEHERAESLGVRALELFTSLDDSEGQAVGYATLGMIAHSAGEWELAGERYGEALLIATQIHDVRRAATVLNSLGDLAAETGQLEAARKHHKQAVELHRSSGDSRGVALSLNNLAIVAGRQGDHRSAVEQSGQSVQAFRELGDRQGLAAALLNLANLSEASGDLNAADDRCGECVELYGELGDPSGIALARELADRLADSHPADVQQDRDADPLTPREREVAQLVGRGHTNREIAERLFISERTVETHVKHIRGKLGITARTQLAIWAAERGDPAS